MYFAQPHFRWREGVLVALGCWLMVSPHLLGFSSCTAAKANALGVGAALAAFNVRSIGRFRDFGEDFFNILIGMWLMLAPWAFAFNDIPVATFDLFIAGAAVISLSMWQIASDVS